MANRQLHIDKEAVATLGLLQDGLLYPVTKLMNYTEAKEVDNTKKYKDTSYPFSFTLAPSGTKNEEVLKTIKKDEILDLVCDKQIRGTIKATEVFKINKDDRVRVIYGTNNPEHMGVKSTYKRLGNYSIYGDFQIDFKDTIEYKNKVQSFIKKSGAKKISAMMLSGKPFHRVHERLIRTALVKCDLMVLFILKPYTDDFIPYEIRYNSIKYFCDNYLPKDKVIIVPLENTYIFGGFNELILNSIVAKNYGCTELIIGKNHAGLGAFYSDEQFCSILDSIEGIDIHIEIMSEFVYCDKCSTLVSTNACPHGSHHHISYHTQSILDLLEMGIMPPAILMRKEISAMILNNLFPNRVTKLKKMNQHLLPSLGLIEDNNSNCFYESLMDLYQTSSLT